MKPPAGPGIRRMLVAFGASASELAGIEAAARLAARAEAELSAMLVEDEVLFRVAALPIARVVGPLAPEGQPIDAASMNRALSAFTAQARSSIARSAAQAGVPWSFRVVRGRMQAEVLAAAAPDDLVVVQSGDAGLAVASGAPCSVLLLGAAARQAHAALVVYGRAGAADRALAAAAQLTTPRPGHPDVTVLLPPGEAREIAERREQAGILLRKLGCRAELHLLRRAGAARLLALAAERGSMLVLNPEAVTRAELEALVREAIFPVLLVR